MDFKKRSKKAISFLENSQLNLKTWLVSFLALISIRLLVESLLLGFPEKNLESFLTLFAHTFSFFLLTYLIFLIFLTTLVKEDFKKVASFLLWGFGIIIFPPIVDKLIFQGDIYKSFYIFDSFVGLIGRFFVFFGENPDWGITWGTRVNIIISLFFISWYVYLKTKNKKKILIGLIGGYVLFFVLSCFPSFVVYFLELGSFMKVSYLTVAGYFMTPFSVFGLKNLALEIFLGKKLALIYLPLVFVLLLGFFYKINSNKIISLIKNLRYPQLIFNLGLLFMGLGLGCFYNPSVFQIDFFSILVLINLGLLVLSVWFFSVLVNDLSDVNIDKITNKNRPLIKKEVSIDEYNNYIQTFFCFSILTAALISPVILVVVVSYHLLTWVYSCYPFRLKRFIGVSSVLISLASLNFLVIGFMIFSENQTLTNFPWRVYWFLFLAYLLITPLKDLKDLEGDRKNQIYTLVVLIGKEKTRLLVASFLFSFYLVSVYILNKQELFLMALFFGTISFLIITNPSVNERKLNGWILGLVFIYGVWVVKTIFL